MAPISFNKQSTVGHHQKYKQKASIIQKGYGDYEEYRLTKYIEGGKVDNDSGLTHEKSKRSSRLVEMVTIDPDSLVLEQG